jgi:hypothetical protein
MCSPTLRRWLPRSKLQPEAAALGRGRRYGFAGSIPLISGEFLSIQAKTPGFGPVTGPNRRRKLLKYNKPDGNSATRRNSGIKSAYQRN